MPMRLAVRRMVSGSKWALSSSTDSVPSVTSEPAPPMTPARAAGVSPSQINRSSGWSARSDPSRVVNVPASPAVRTTMRRLAMLWASKAWRGCPVSSMT